MPRYIVTIAYEYTEVRHKEYAIGAGSWDEAEKIASEQFYEEHETEEIDSITSEMTGSRY